MHALPTKIFSYLKPGELRVPPEARKALVAAGYDMDAWDQGELLTVNERWPSRRGTEAMMAGLVESYVNQVAGRSA